MSNSQRRAHFRYVVDLAGVRLTPLAAIQCYLGEESVRVLNVSLGGLAIIFEREKDFEVGDIIELSLSIRERAYPVSMEIRGKMGLRFSCQFVEASALLLNALKEFLAPKGIGESFKLREDLNDNAEALRLVPGSAHYFSFVGEQDSVAFVWEDAKRLITKFLIVSQAKFLEWTAADGIKTGNIQEDENEELSYHSEADAMCKQYFADVLLSWLSFEKGHDFTVQIMESSAGGGQVQFPHFDS